MSILAVISLMLVAFLFGLCYGKSDVQGDSSAILLLIAVGGLLVCLGYWLAS